VSQPANPNPYQPPQTPNSPTPPPPGAGGDEPVSYVIPYKNVPALIAYYLGVFSFSACIPILGIVGVGMGIAALVLGIRGLKVAAANPQAHGRVHAWIGIIGGTVFALIGLAINIAMIVGMLANRR
jgi:hypothetical protein